jgi:hypothetical protein
MFAFKRMAGVEENLADVIIARLCCNLTQILKFATFYGVIV